MMRAAQPHDQIVLVILCTCGLVHCRPLDWTAG
jgi:hypothetical protein